jgi:hypothetical protein
MRFLNWLRSLVAVSPYKTEEDLGPQIPVLPPEKNPFSPFYKGDK